MIDCLIAAVALREGASVLHNDADVDVIPATRAGEAKTWQEASPTFRAVCR